jgi:ornithine--oxo-acid transaminase
VPFGDIEALRAAMSDETIAVLLEPIQGEGGVVIPPDGFLQQVRALCTERGVLMIADEIQSGLARTGRTFACDHEQVVPDIYVLGKALGGGIMPLSAIAADGDVMGVITPGSHGSTFGGNPFAAAIGREVVAMLSTGEFQARAASLGEVLAGELAGLLDHGVVEVRSRGLWAGIDVDPTIMSGKELCYRMADRGVLAKDTHGSTIRLAPPIVATDDEIRMMVGVIKDSLAV